LFFILIKLPNFLSDIHDRHQNTQRLFLKRMQTIEFNLYKSEFIQNPVFYFSIYFGLAKYSLHLWLFSLIILQMFIITYCAHSGYCCFQFSCRFNTLSVSLFFWIQINQRNVIRSQDTFDLVN
jgi:hypothetical protein